MDNLEHIDFLYDQSIINNLGSKTQNCGFMWQNVGIRQYRAIHGDFEYWITNLPDKIVLDIINKGDLYQSYNSLTHNSLEDLYDEVVQWVHANNRIETFVKSVNLERCIQPASMLQLQTEEKEEIKRCVLADTLFLIDTNSDDDYRFIIDVMKAIRTDCDNVSCRWALAEYGDFKDNNNGWNLVHPFVQNYDELLGNINALKPKSHNVDLPCQQLAALKNAALMWTSLLKGVSSSAIQRQIVWIGGSPGWNGHIGSVYHPMLQDVKKGLQESKINLIALNLRSAEDGIDGSAPMHMDINQASYLVKPNGYLHNSVLSKSFEDIVEVVYQALI